MLWIKNKVHAINFSNDNSNNNITHNSFNLMYLELLWNIYGIYKLFNLFFRASRTWEHDRNKVTLLSFIFFYLIVFHIVSFRLCFFFIQHEINSSYGQILIFNRRFIYIFFISYFLILFFIKFFGKSWFQKSYSKCNLSKINNLICFDI